MTRNSSATALSETSHVSADLKQRAESIINNKAIDGATRKVLRYALEIDDPLLCNLVRRVNDGEGIIDDHGFLRIGD